MAKWKELGEVPDSDDESALDSQESQQELPLPDPKLRDDGTTDDPYKGGRLVSQDRDVWDIPPSSSQPDQVKDVPGESSNLEPQPASTPPSPHSSPSEQLPDEVDVAPTASPQTQDREEQAAGVENETGSTPRADPANQFVDSAFEAVDVPTEDRGLIPEAVPYSRSLRPRKPIQEHPYLLESAQYSKVLKSHGIRPVKVRIEEAARRRQEDSQEQDYEDDSQLTAKDPNVEESEESQVLDPPGLFDDLDELALSPPRRPSASPPEDTRIGDLIRSSQADEEEFPDPADVARWKALGAPRSTSKRHASPKLSAKRKVLKRRAPDTSTNALSPLSRRIDVFDVPPSPPQTSPALLLTTPMTNPAGQRPATALTPKPSSVFSSRNQSPAPANQNSRLIDLTMQDDRGDSDEDDEVPGSSPEDEADVLLRNSRRIRGVLPASWLRLDQQTTRLPPKRADTRRSLERSPERSHRKGVAQRRQVSSKPNIDAPFFFNDSDSDNDETNLRHDETNDFANNSTFNIFEDDAGSVIEEDHIDRMFPGGKRTSGRADGQERPRKKRKGERSTFKGQPGQRKRQQRITGLLGRAKSTSSTGHNRRDGHTSASYTKKSTTTRIMPSTPPRLSILDVTEPDAPVFIRIAARAARQRPGKGRSSPSMKRISLAKQPSMNNFLSVETETVPGPTDPENAEPQSSRRPAFDRPQNLESTSRPAQLETAGENVSRYAFTTRKKALDALYRKSHKTLPAPVNLRLDRILEKSAPASDAHQGTKDVPAETPEAAASVTRRRLKSRKHLRPQRLDTSAPQYAHANDPLPREASPIVDVVDVREDNTKLLGLGPFDEKNLQWGSWDAQTSSELGILCDWIADRLSSEDTLEELPRILRICQKFDMMSECFKLEELLKDVAKHTCKRLLQTDLRDIRLLFDDLQRMSYRERGIRDDQHSAVCWVVLIRVLEEARIPRSGFWDVLSPVMLEADASSIVDAHDFERLWCNLFTLLPLGEFDNSGLLVPGIRHTMPLEGWWLPQKLLGRIFQLYKSNSRQSPSFNDYCRGLYVKEKGMHETELAALRNHHDLLCTLFWAAPPDLRPPIQLIEKLVVPGSSHKEACLVNLRAWNQLARYIISSGEDISAYKPFADWQKTAFKQVMDQYSSAESDIQQQFLRMSKDASRTISQDLMNSVIKANKKASLDVLHFSMKTVLDVMRHAPTLAATSFVVRHYQLDQIFTRFSSSPADFDWSSLRAGVDIIDYYTRRIEEFLCRQPEHLDSETSWHGEDAILVGPNPSLISATLIRKRVFDFKVRRSHLTTEWTVLTCSKDLGATALELFLCAITKPFQYTAYENRLAEAMKRNDDPYLIDAFIDVGGSPDYNSNRDLFSHIISKMRKSLRFAEAGQKPQLQGQFAKALRAVMEQIKQDLKLMITNPPEHSNYIDFVRNIVALIRSHDICPVDPYYYQISPEYSPSRQDPRLQTAGILACGLKLEEGNPHAASGLFYLLWPNFTTALANGKLADECAILEQGMRHSHVFSFMLGKMFPAVLRTAARRPEGWVLMETYVGALEKWMAGPAVHKEIAEENMDNALALLKSADASMRHLKGLDISDLRPEHLYSLIHVLKLLNLLAPSLNAYLINEPTSLEAGEITKTIDALTSFTGAAGSYISALLERPQPRAEAAATIGPREHQPSFTLDPARLFEGIVQSPSHHQPDSPDTELINNFSAYMVRDIGNTWAIVTSPSSNINSGPTMAALTVRGPARPSATQSGQGAGTLVPGWGRRTLAKQLREQAWRWNSTWALVDGAGEMADMGSSGSGRWEERCAALDDCVF
ncbi:hypothetical protein DL768_003374 [Monosporascus sp. mg162]|nr:hypothetical protein DL768_003374 [Monosporascus sp. mg162]